MDLLCPAEVFEQVSGAADSGFTVPQRVLWVAPDEDVLVTIGIEPSLKRPKVYSLQEIMRLLHEGSLQRIEVKLRPYLLQSEDVIMRRSLNAYFGERAHPFRSIAPTCA
jgi:putative transposase